MTKPEDKIHRRVFFVWADDLDAEGKDNNTWRYFRAPEGKKFLLDSVTMSVVSSGDVNDGIIMLFDGHEYTQWNIFPGVVCHETLARIDTISATFPYNDVPLHMWETKEITIACRSNMVSQNFRAMVIVWYYLQNMSKEETYEYAVKYPRYSYRKGGPSTLNPRDE